MASREFKDILRKHAVKAPPETLPEAEAPPQETAPLMPPTPPLAQQEPETPDIAGEAVKAGLLTERQRRRVKDAPESAAGAGFELVAVQMGFCSHAHFTAAFRRAFGFGPSVRPTKLAGTN